MTGTPKGSLKVVLWFKGIYFVIYGIISEFTDKGQFQSELG